MSLPRVVINFASGALGRIAPGEDGVTGLVTSGVAVSTKFALGTSYTIRSMADLADLGIDADSTGANAGLFKVVSEFFGEAGTGAELWLMGVADTVTLTQMADTTNEHAKKLITDANGRIRTLMVHRTPPVAYAPTITEGIDPDAVTAIAKAQLLGEYSVDTLKAPLLVLLPALLFDGTVGDLPDLSQRTDDRVAMLLGDTEDAGGCAIGLLGGRLAKMPVQRNCGRVKDGAIWSNSIYQGEDPYNNSDAESIHNKGFITFRTHVGRAGYYFTDDPLCNLITDDYNGIAVRRVIDKAWRLAYAVMANELLEEVTVNDAGQVSVSYAKYIETRCENAIINGMTVNGELGNDPADQNDTGVECLVDHTQNIIATSKLALALRVKPHGYARYIEVELGFKTLTA